MEIKQLQELYNTSDSNIKWAKHCLERMQERDISRDDVGNCIMSGEIIEEYADDYPYPSCLILGKQNDQVPLHAVVASNGEELFIITAYYPSDEQWEDDWKTRKEQQK